MPDGYQGVGRGTTTGNVALPDPGDNGPQDFDDRKIEGDRH